jgi:hypothetical protein
VREESPPIGNYFHSGGSRLRKEARARWGYVFYSEVIERDRERSRMIENVRGVFGSVLGDRVLNLIFAKNFLVTGPPLVQDGDVLVS